VEIRQNAVIQLKNYVINYWKYGTNSKINECLKFEKEEIIVQIKDSDKELIRSNLIQIASNCTIKPILKHFNQIIQKIVRYDFQNGNWANLIPNVTELLSTNDEKLVYSGINVILQIAKIFEFENNEYRKPYTEVLNYFWEKVTSIMEQVLPNFSNPTAIHIIKKILKVYLTSIKVNSL